MVIKTTMFFPWKTIGHERQKEEFERNIAENNVAHAYLFSGPADIGKMYFAKECARALLCPNNMCRTCTICRQMDNFTHPDFLVLDMLYIDKVNTDWDEISKHSNILQESRSTGVKAKTDKIGISIIRDLQEKIQEKPLGKYKVCIINKIDRITPEATNAFLKTIEEPPHGTIFIFTTAKESSLLSTLLSRMRIVRFNHLSNALIESSIEEKYPQTKDKKTIVEFAQGRITTAFELSKNPQKLEDMEQDLKEVKEVLSSNSLKKQFAFVESIVENPEAIEKFFEYSYYYLRSQLDAEAQNTALFIEQLEKTENLMEQNVNKRLLLENFFLNLYT